VRDGVGDVYYGFARDTFTFQAPRVMLGWGALRGLGELATKQGLNKVVVVTDEGLVRAGLLDQLEEVLRGAGVNVLGVFDSVEPEPSVATVKEASELLRETRPDGVIGFGGGSCLDAAKAASVAAVHEAPIEDQLGMDKVPGPGLTTILVPTTAGTSSEITQVAVLTDKDGNKRVMYSGFLLAELALVDPELTVGLPPRQTAGTGLDTLVHAIESYVSVLRNPVSDLCAERAIRLIAANLRTAVLKGRHSPEARYNMSLAATIAGFAFANSSVAAVHAISLPFGTKYKVAHGEANAVVLPHVMRYCAPADVARYADVARWLGVPDEGRSIEELALASADAAERLVRDCGFEPRLSAYGVDREDFSGFADVALEVQSHNLERNPRDLDREDLLRIYEAAL
jgi:alcohol dehydrogenase